jgi:hypothetical protein
MKPLAWLGFYREKWHLMTSKLSDPVRQWIDKETALSDLAGEGWSISGPNSEILNTRTKSGERFSEYELNRIVY